MVETRPDDDGPRKSKNQISSYELQPDTLFEEVTGHSIEPVTV